MIRNHRQHHRTQDPESYDCLRERYRALQTKLSTTDPAEVSEIERLKNLIIEINARLAKQKGIK